jgi:3-dehydroquinate synthase
MHSIQQEIRLTFRYEVHFTNGVFDPANCCLRDTLASEGTSNVVFVIDRQLVESNADLTRQIERYCAAHNDAMHLAAPCLVIDGGEESKNSRRYLDQVLETIHSAGLCRHSYIVAVGGGAVLDVVGFAAGIAHRGIRLVRVPTTVLSQNDSGLGVKNGINAFDKKNYLGTFAPPFAVINDFALLGTLSDRDWRAGISEAIKVALIRDKAFFEDLERNVAALLRREPEAGQRMIRRCAELHLAHIAQGGDPFELGSSRPLDFGHWSAHKLERLSEHRLRHGEAVAIGTALDTTYSYLTGLLAEPEWRRILELLLALGLPIYARELGSNLEEGNPRCILHGLAEFREHLGGNLTITLLRSVGKALDVHEIDRATMIRSIEMLGEISADRCGELAAAGNHRIAAPAAFAALGGSGSFDDHNER